MENIILEEGMKVVIEKQINPAATILYKLLLKRYFWRKFLTSSFSRFSVLALTPKTVNEPIIQQMRKIVIRIQNVKNINFTESITEIK